MILSGKRGLTGIAAYVMAGVLFGLNATPAVSAEDLPSIEQLVTPKDKKDKDGNTVDGKKKPEFPRKLEEEETNLEISKLLPPGPFFYFEAGNGEQACANFEKTSVARFLARKKVVKFLRNNPLTLANLFVNLPERYSNSAMLGLYSVGAHFARTFARTDSRVVLAAYKGGTTGPQVIFMADIGADRKAPYDKLCSLRDKALADYPGIVLEETPKSDDYIDVMRSTDRKGELAFGFVRNYVVVCTNAEFARNLLTVAKAGGAGKSLAGSNAFREISRNTDSSSSLRGFIDLRAMLTEVAVNQLPGATEMLDLGCDLLGRGVLYYDMKIDGKRLLEHLVSTTRVNADAGERPGVPARIMQVCSGPAEGAVWTTAKIIPYQPEFFLAMRVKPGVFADLMAAPQPLGSSAYSTQISITIPAALRAPEGFLQILKPDADRLMTGEVAMALLPVHEDKRPWIFVMALQDAPATIKALAVQEPAQNISGLNIYSLDPQHWQQMPCWVVISQSTFQNLGTSQLVLASSGNLLHTVIDQTTAVAASLAENKDFTTQLTALGDGQSVIWYYNLPGVISREYVNLPVILRTYFPPLGNISNRPPMSLVNKYFSGIAGGVRVKPEDLACRSTMVGPLPTIPALAGLLGVGMPQWIRERARMYLSKSRQNLGRIWLELQTYATQRGHYPESMEELRRLFSRFQQRNLFVSLAAVEQKGLEEAARNSYTYVLGLRPTDEPDRPILYESAPWHYEYTGMMRPKGPQPMETGDYLRWRLVLQLDGTIRAYTEDEFKKRVLPRIKVEE